MKGRKKIVLYILITGVVFSFGAYLMVDRGNLWDSSISAVKDIFRGDTHKDSKNKDEDVNKGTSGKEKDSQSQTGTEKEPVIYSSDNPLNNLKPLLDKYGFKMREIENIERIKLPESFNKVENGVPVGIGLAIANEVSKVIGLDFSSYMGKEVTTYTISAYGKAGGAMEKMVLLIYERKIIGCWLQDMNFYKRALDGRVFQEIIGSSWDSWLIKNAYDEYHGPMPNTASPEEVIKKYYQDINSKKYESAFSSFSMFYKVMWLYSDDLTHSRLLPAAKISVDIFYGANYVTIKNISCQNTEGPVRLSNEEQGVVREFYSIKYYIVETVSKFNTAGKIEEKPVNYYIQLIKTTADSPWRIDSIGTNLY